MKRKWFFQSSVLIILIVLLTTSAALGDSLGYSLDWWTVDGGGEISTGGDYSLSGTIGQPETGLMQGDDFTLAGGFWSNGDLTRGAYEIYLPVVIR